MSAPMTSIELPTWESQRLLAGVAVGHLCIIDRGVPVAFPINYAIEENPEGRKAVAVVRPQSVLARYTGPASLQVGHIDGEADGMWSVIAVGELTCAYGRTAMPLVAPVMSIDRVHVVELRILSITGRRFTAGRTTTESHVVPWQLAAN